MRVNLSVAIVYMVKDPGMAWHESQQGIILGMFFYGYVLTQLPGGRLAEVIGKAKERAGCGFDGHTEGQRTE